MKRYVVLHCGSKDHRREIDDEGRIILGHIGSTEPVYRTLRTSIRGSTNEEKAKDLKERISRLIDLSAPLDSVEFVEE
jgi:hypothetical protein